jgi:tricorn protease-like protein
MTQAWPVVWLDSFGKMQSLLSVRGVYIDPRFSPDGRRLALMKRSTGVDIFIYDWQRDATTRLTWAGGTIRINLGIGFSEWFKLRVRQGRKHRRKISFPPIRLTK